MVMSLKSKRTLKRPNFMQIREAIFYIIYSILIAILASHLYEIYISPSFTEELMVVNGNELLSKGQWNMSIDSFDDAIHINPGSERAWLGKGIARYKLKNYADAINCFEMTLNINPKHNHALFNLGLAYFRLAEASNDNAAYEMALKCFYEVINNSQKESQSWNEIGNIYKSINRTNEADKAFEKAREMSHGMEIIP
jgi:tetratricopeptide (TPR) repeat protein